MVLRIALRRSISRQCQNQLLGTRLRPAAVDTRLLSYPQGYGGQERRYQDRRSGSAKSRKGDLESVVSEQDFLQSFSKPKVSSRRSLDGPRTPDLQLDLAISGSKPLEEQPGQGLAETKSSDGHRKKVAASPRPKISQPSSSPRAAASRTFSPADQKHAHRAETPAADRVALQAAQLRQPTAKPPSAMALEKTPAPVQRESKASLARRERNAFRDAGKTPKADWRCSGGHRSRVAGLGVDSLGKPAEALIIHLANEPPPRKKPAQAKKLKGKAAVKTGTKTKKIAKEENDLGEQTGPDVGVQDEPSKGMRRRSRVKKYEQGRASNEAVAGRAEKTHIYTAAVPEPEDSTERDDSEKAAQRAEDVAREVDYSAAIDRIEAIVAEQDRELTDEEVFQHIDQFRPSKAVTRLTVGDYEALVKKVMESFTRKQLETYIRLFPEEDGPAAQPPWILSFPQYVMDTRNITANAESSSKSPQSLPKKESVLIHILTDLWGMSVPRHSGRGYMDVRLRDIEFSLLLAGSQRALNFMAKFYLTHGGRIEAFPNSQTIRIVAEKTTAYKILDEMNSLLADVASETIQLTSLNKTTTLTKLLDGLAQMTNSYIKANVKKKQVQVYWLHLSDRPKHLETVGQTVYRLLLQLLYKWPGSSSCLLPGPKTEKKLRFIEPSYDRMRWEWQQRLGRWVRLVNAVPAGTMATPPPQSSGTGLLIDGWDLEPANAAEGDSNPARYTSCGWCIMPQTLTKITFGHLLFPLTAQDPEIPTSRSYDASPASRLLSPVVPPIQGLTSLVDTSPLDTDHLVLRLFPRLGANKQLDHLGQAPPLELRLNLAVPELDHGVKPNAMLRIREAASLRALLADRTTDMLFPSAAVDARVYQARYVQFMPTRLPKHKQVGKFLSLCDFNLSKGKLATPPSVTIPMPKRLFVNRNEKLPTEEVPLDESMIRVDRDYQDEVVDVAYTFMGLDTQRHIESKLTDSSYLTYTSIEGGKGSGNRAEFSLVPFSNHRGRQGALLGYPRDDLIDQIYDVVHGRAFPWEVPPDL